MFSVFIWTRDVIKRMKPSTIREIIIIAVILIISIVLSLPQYKQDKERLRMWNETHQNVENLSTAEKFYLK